VGVEEGGGCMTRWFTMPWGFMFMFVEFMAKEGALEDDVVGRKFGGRDADEDGMEAPYGEDVYGVWYWATEIDTCQHTC
jgi:hypothetical protein